MYDRDVPLIRQIALESDHGFVRVVTLALLSIRQPFSRMQRQMQDVAQSRQESVWLWGNKRSGRQFTLDHAGRLRGSLIKPQPAEVAIKTLCSVPGLGLVKSGFVAQMLGYNVGCLDIRNIARLGLSHKQTYFNKHQPEHIRLRRIHQYVALCSALGGARTLWDMWCEEIARDGFFLTADHVSRYHLECVQSKE